MGLLLKVAIIGGLIGQAAASVGEIVADWVDPVVDHCFGSANSAANSAANGGSESGVNGASSEGKDGKNFQARCRQKHSAVRHVLRAIVLILLAAIAIKFLDLGGSAATQAAFSGR